MVYALLGILAILTTSETKDIDLDAADDGRATR